MSYRTQRERGSIKKRSQIDPPGVSARHKKSVVDSGGDWSHFLLLRFDLIEKKSLTSNNDANGGTECCNGKKNHNTIVWVSNPGSKGPKSLINVNLKFSLRQCQLTAALACRGEERS